MASSEFSAKSKFRVDLVHSDGSSDRVSVQIGLDGLVVSDANSGRSLKSYELGHITRWQSKGLDSARGRSSLVLYTRTPSDVEERQLTLQGDEYTIRSALDTLTCSCMQLAELLQSKQTTDAQETANSLHALVAGDGKKKSSTKLPSADDVEYWTAPAMEGWLQSQGDHIKSWRKRWFVLKQGYLFRFMNASVSESTKPRGVVDLSKIQDVSQATKTTGRAFSFQLKTASGGSVCYLCESETELVMWMSAINREVERIVKKLAGVEEEPAPTSSAAPAKGSSKSSSKAAGGGGGGGSSAAAAPSEWMRQLERNFDNMSTSTNNNQTSSSARNNHAGSAMIDVVGYETIGGGGGSGGGGRDGGRGHKDAYGSHTSSSNNNNSHYGGGYGGGTLDYSQIAGVGGVAGGGGLSADTLLNYGGGGGGGPAAGHTGGSSGYGRPAPQQQQQQASALSSYGSGSAGPYGGGYGSGGAPSGYGNGGGAYGGGYGQAHQQQPAYHQQQQQQPAQQQQQQQQGYGSVSLIDQVPQSQPSYPYYQQGAGVPQAAPASQQQSQWQVHHTAEGRPYYYNLSTGVTQWEPPPGL